MVFLKLSRKDFEVDDAVRRDRDRGCRFAIKAPAGEHRRVLHGRHIAMPGLAGLRRKRERVGLSAAAGEDHVLGLRADQCRHLGARRLDRCAGRPSLRMHGRRITVKRQRRGNSLADFIAKRSGGVIVEIGTLVHLCRSSRANPRRLTLARAPVARAMKRGPSRPKMPSCSGAALFGTILILTCRIPERQSQVLRRRFRVSPLPCATPFKRWDPYVNVSRPVIHA